MRLAFLCLSLLASLATPARAAASAFAADGHTALSDEELASFRGGFQLPGGIGVSLGVTTDTRVDGQLVLRTVFTAAGGPALRIFGRGEGGAPQELDLAAGQAATGDGVVRLRELPAGSRIEFAGNGLNINHIVGQAFGSAIANSGNDRAIDVVTTVDLELSNATPDMVGSSFFRVEAAALDATRQLAR